MLVGCIPEASQVLCDEGVNVGLVSRTAAGRGSELLVPRLASISTALTQIVCAVMSITIFSAVL